MKYFCSINIENMQILHWINMYEIFLKYILYRGHGTRVPEFLTILTIFPPFQLCFLVFGKG